MPTFKRVKAYHKFGSHIVYKPFDLVDASYNMSHVELKLLALALSTYDRYLLSFKTLRLRIPDFLRNTLGKPSNAYGWVREAIAKFQANPPLLKMKNGETIVTPWFHVEWITKSLFELSLDPVLQDMVRKSKATVTYPLSDILLMKSRYAIRMYEYFKKLPTHSTEVTIKTTDLREMLGCPDTVKSYSTLKTHVLEPALEALYEMNSLRVDVTEYNIGRSILKLKFELTDERV